MAVGVSGLVDSSGIRFYYTRHLRKYDAGIMELGVEYTDKLAVPPGQTSWPMTGYCIDSCTETVSSCRHATIKTLVNPSLFEQKTSRS